MASSTTLPTVLYGSGGTNGSWTVSEALGKEFYRQIIIQGTTSYPTGGYLITPALFGFNDFVHQPLGIPVPTTNDLGSSLTGLQQGYTYAVPPWTAQAENVAAGTTACASCYAVAEYVYGNLLLYVVLAAGAPTQVANATNLLSGTSYWTATLAAIGH